MQFKRNCAILLDSERGNLIEEKENFFNLLSDRVGNCEYHNLPLEGARPRILPNLQYGQPEDTWTKTSVQSQLIVLSKQKQKNTKEGPQDQMTTPLQILKYRKYWILKLKLSNFI